MNYVLTAKAQTVVDRACEEARRHHHIWVGSEHLLLALFLEGGIAKDILYSAGVRVRKLIKLVEIHNLKARRANTDPKMLVSGKWVLKIAFEEATKLGGDSADSIHILLGIIGMPPTAALIILDEFGVSREMIRTSVSEHLAVAA
jgi:ATP-dependent Clp protease ATP-binding subunit ClpC